METEFLDSDTDELATPAERLRTRTRFAFILLAVLVFGFIGLAALIQIGGAVIGVGEVTVESSVKTLSHPTGGVLAEVLVRNGDHVKAGQPLLRLDTSVTGVGSTSATTGLAELRARKARLEAERDGAATILFPPELNGAETQPLLARERGVFELRRRQRAGILALLGERVRQYDQQIASYRAQINATNSQEALIRPELDGLRKLYARQLVTISRINQLERTAVQLNVTRATLQSSIAEARARISETREQMLNVDKTSRSDAATELAQVSAQLNDQTVRSASASDMLNRSIIRAPQSGVVDKLAYNAIGSAIPPAQPILQIVPDRDQLVIEARIRPQDVDQVRVGQSARVAFSSLDRQTTPDVRGTIRFVAPDLTQDQRTGASFFRIRVQLDRNSVARAPGLVLKAGMPVETYVETGGRSIMSFLLKPLMDQLRNALREG